jgi:hypothetical protein
LPALKEESLFPSMEVIFDFWKDSLPEGSGWEFTDIWVVILAVFSAKLQGLTWELKIHKGKWISDHGEDPRNDICYKVHNIK